LAAAEQVGDHIFGFPKSTLELPFSDAMRDL